MVVSWLNLGLKRLTQKPEFHSLNFVGKKGRSIEEGKNRVQVKGNDLREEVLDRLKVHKIENFLAPILNFVLFNC
jgi:hypothetical protein